MRHARQESRGSSVPRRTLGPSLGFYRAAFHCCACGGRGLSVVSKQEGLGHQRNRCYEHCSNRKLRSTAPWTSVPPDHAARSDGASRALLPGIAQSDPGLVRRHLPPRLLLICVGCTNGCVPVWQHSCQSNRVCSLWIRMADCAIPFWLWLRTGQSSVKAR